MHLIVCQDCGEREQRTGPARYCSWCSLNRRSGRCSILMQGPMAQQHRAVRGLLRLQENANVLA